MPQRRRPSLAEIAADLRATAGPQLADELPVPGEFFGSRLVDPSGVILSRERKLRPSEAATLVRTGAAVAFEGCGCDGYAGCQPKWLDDEERNALASAGSPRTDTRSDQPAWIQLWTGDGRPDVQVVMVNGPARWGRVLPRQ